MSDATVTASTIAASSYVGSPPISTGTWLVTVDLTFLSDAVAFTRAFDGSFRTTDENDPLRRVTVVDGVQVVEQDNYGFVPARRPQQRLWERFSFPPTPLGLLLFRDEHRIKVVIDFNDPEYLDADDALMGGHMPIIDSSGWQRHLLEEWGFTIVDITQPPSGVLNIVAETVGARASIPAVVVTADVDLYSNTYGNTYGA